MKSTDIILKLKPGDHLCLLYETDGDHTTILRAFLRQGLEKKEKIIYVGDPETSRSIDSLIGRDDPLVKTARSAGRIVSRSWDQLKQKGALTPESFIEFIRSELDSGSCADSAGLRIATEATPFISELEPEELIEFESKLDSFLIEQQCLALCQYNILMMDSAFILDLLLTHPVVLNGMEAADNFYYARPPAYEKGNFPQIAAKHLLRILHERKSFENKLAKEEELFKTYIDIAGVIIIIVDKNEKVKLINRKGSEILEYPQEEIVGKNWFDHFLPEGTREKTRTYFNDLLAGRTQLEHGENPIITKSGKERIIFWHNLAIMNENGELEGTLSSGEDITERKQNELAVKKSEEKYRSLFEHALEGIFQITPEGRVLSVNPAYAHMLGFQSPQEMIARISDFAQQHYVRPQERKKLMEEIERNGKVIGFETQFFRLDGEKIWVSINARAVKNPTGEVAYYEGMVEDISLRKHSEEQLNKTLHNLRTAMEGTIHAIAMTVEAKDPYTAGHQQHVGTLARAIARHMGLSPDVIAGIYLAGVIHDLGKISIPSEFLSKPGKLTEYEYILIKTHPEAGYKILRGIDFPWPVAEIILQHHERMDGSGYPRGLKEKEILTEAKIIAVADVVEAITFNRPYRPAYGLNLALLEIKQSEGVLFDTESAEACLDLFKEENLPWQSLFEARD